MKLIILLVLPFLLFSCTNAEKRTSHSDPGITIEQQAAFDALNTLQVGTDVPNRLYSTFANIDQPCYPADTSFVISQHDLFMVMKIFISENCKYMSVEQQSTLAETSAQAQDEYRVLHCSDNSENENYEGGLPMTGTWVMPNVLGRRDVIIVW